FPIAVGLQLGIAALFLNWPAARSSLDGLNGVVAALEQATQAGTSFLFGYVGRSSDMPFEAADGGGGFFIFAFQALPLLVFISALAAVLWHWGILKVIIRGFALFISRVLGTGGAVSLAASANVLLGQTEAPLLIRPYLAKLTRSELFAVIGCGYATVAGTVMVLYGIILSSLSPTMLGHILVASLISVPAALIMAQIIVPPSSGEVSTSSDDVQDGFAYDSTMDAFTSGAVEGGKLWANIIIAILAFIALAALINIIFDAALPDVLGAPLTIERIFAWIFAPFIWLAGLPADQVMAGAELMGIKTAINEVVAYEALAGLAPDALDERSTLIMVYAMCGFANIGSLGIVIGGFTALEPSRRKEVLELAPKALVAGTLATLSSGAVVGLLWT
ncbi:MAG: nucleoside transporter C-terminal domain-containing protein, partial [Pseudomonadota bacterium]